MPKVLITNTCYVRDRCCRKGATVEFDDETAADVVASRAGVVVNPPGPPPAAAATATATVQAAPAARTAVDPTATAAVRSAVKLGG